MYIIFPSDASILLFDDISFLSNSIVMFSRCELCYARDDPLVGCQAALLLALYTTCHELSLLLDSYSVKLSETPACFYLRRSL